MLYLTQDEALGNFRQYGAVLALRACEGDSREDYSTVEEFDEHVGHCRQLAVRMSNWLKPFSECTLLVTEYGIWPSSENLHLLHRLRLSYSESRPLHMAPGHLFFEFESQELDTHLHLALIFGWGGVALTNDGKIVRFSHDGWVAFIDADSSQNGSH